MMHGSVRMARNVAEKQRRDRLNSFINDLANSVPLVASATRRLDKTSILRLSAAFLRLHDSPLNVVSYRQTAKDIVNNVTSENEISCSPSPVAYSSSCLTGEQLNVLMEGLDGFVIVVNSDFKLIYVGPTCERFLGHQNIDMLGHQLSAFLHPGDIGPVRQAVLDLKNQFLSSGQLKSKHIQVRCRMKERAQPRTEVVTYQIVKISGFFQLAACSSNISQSEEAADVTTPTPDDHPVGDDMSSSSSVISFPAAVAAVASGTTFAAAASSTHISTNGLDFESNPLPSAYSPSVTQDADLSDLDFQLSDFTPDSRSSFYSDFIADCPPQVDHPSRAPLHPPYSLPQTSSSSNQLSQPSRHLMPLNGNYCSDKSSNGSCSSNNNANNNNHFNFSTTPLSSNSSASSQSSWPSPAKERQKQNHHHSSNKKPLTTLFSGKFLSRNVLFKGFVEIVPASPMSELSLMDANQEEYVSRIALDGTLLYADHRISLVLGYTPDEVIGKSAYKYILVPDHVISLFAHKLMLSSSNGTGIVVHRLKTRSGGYIYLQSAGCLQYDRYTGKVDHFVNVGRMLPESEGFQEMQKFIRKFAPHVSSDSPSSLYRSLQMAIAPKTMSSIPPLPTQQEQEYHQQQEQLKRLHDNRPLDHHQDQQQSSNLQFL